MRDTSSLSRRHFVQLAAAAAVSSPLLARGAEESSEGYLNGRLYKTLKIGMVRAGKSLEEKFAIAKEAGFDGIELNAPTINIEEVRAAIKATGLPVDGTVNAGHWGVRHTDADPETRAKALESLKEALRQTHAVGGNSVLLVVGRGSDGPEEEIWKRSIENISKAIPLAAELGIHIAIENVWNQFCYDHDGDHNQTADKFVKYVDEFHSPWVGMQFDIGNHWKYGSMGDWIRQLDKRVVKLDLKGFSREMSKFTKIGEGDLERLKEVSANMDRVFGLTPSA